MIKFLIINKINKKLMNNLKIITVNRLQRIYNLKQMKK